MVIEADDAAGTVTFHFAEGQWNDIALNTFLTTPVNIIGPEWDELTAALNGNRDRAAIHQAVHEELGSVCERILGNTAVFKTKEQTVAFLAELRLTRQ